MNPGRATPVGKIRRARACRGGRLYVEPGFGGKEGAVLVALPAGRLAIAAGRRQPGRQLLAEAGSGVAVVLRCGGQMIQDQAVKTHVAIGLVMPAQVVAAGRAQGHLPEPRVVVGEVQGEMAEGQAARGQGEAADFLVDVVGGGGGVAVGAAHGDAQAGAGDVHAAFGADDLFGIGQIGVAEQGFGENGGSPAVGEQVLCCLYGSQRVGLAHGASSAAGC